MNDRNKTLYNVMIAIQSKLSFSIESMSMTLEIEQTRYKKWINDKQFDILSDEESRNLLLFIDIYDAVFSLFVETRDAIDWYRTEIIALDKKTPLEYMKLNENGVKKVNEYINYQINP